jgi:hypothetical protein
MEWRRLRENADVVVRCYMVDRGDVGGLLHRESLDVSRRGMEYVLLLPGAKLLVTRLSQ